MIETVREFDGKRFLLRLQESQDPLPLVICILHARTSEEIEEAAGRPLNLLLPLDLDWDEDLSPWPEGQLVFKEDHFTGGAPAYARTVAKAADWARKQAPVSQVILAGYSMGGLFSLYAPTQAGCYDALVSASGSVWYPDFVSYMEKTAFRKAPGAIYLSLGDRETRARNSYLRTTAAAMEALAGTFEEQGIPCSFVTEPGGHFDDAIGRVCRGIRWCLGQL